jgi:hypothetical protein
MKIFYITASSLRVQNNSGKYNAQNQLKAQSSSISLKVSKFVQCSVICGKWEDKKGIQRISTTSKKSTSKTPSARRLHVKPR